MLLNTKTGCLKNTAKNVQQNLKRYCKNDGEINNKECSIIYNNVVKNAIKLTD